MKPKDVLRYYKSRYRFHKITGMSAATLGNWVRWGYVPIDAQYKIEKWTKGDLKVDKSDIPDKKKLVTEQEIYSLYKSSKKLIERFEDKMYDEIETKPSFLNHFRKAINIFDELNANYAERYNVEKGNQK